MTKIQNIQALRGIAVLSVVLFHITVIEQKYGGGNALLPDIFQFGMFGVDLFFVISGFVMIAISRKQYDGPKFALKFLYHRATRIYPLYWIFTLLIFAISLIQPSWVNSSQGGDFNLASSLLLLPSERLPLLMVGWTLIHEMYFYLMFFLVLLFTGVKYFPIALIIWGIAVLSMNLLSPSVDPLITLVSHPLTFEFLGGCSLAIIFFKKTSFSNPRMLLTTATIVLLAALYSFHEYQSVTGYLEPKGWWRILILGVPAMVISYCLINAEQSGYIIHRYLSRIGDASYSIYLSHILVLSSAGRIWGELSNASLSDNIVAVPVLLALVITFGIISYRIIEKPLLDLSRKIG